MIESLWLVPIIIYYSPPKCMMYNNYYSIYCHLQESRFYIILYTTLYYNCKCLSFLQSGYYSGTVTTTSGSVVREIETLTSPENLHGYGDGGATVDLLLYLEQRFGPVSSFSGSYRADRWDLTVQRTAGFYIFCDILYKGQHTI